MSDIYTAVPIPDDLTKIRSIHDGSRWNKSVVPGSVKVSDGIITFVVNWSNGRKRRFILTTDHVNGYECDE